jgi:hypothetical protein
MLSAQFVPHMLALAFGTFLTGLVLAFDTCLTGPRHFPQDARLDAPQPGLATTSPFPTSAVLADSAVLRGLTRDEISVVELIKKVRPFWERARWAEHRTLSGRGLRGLGATCL